MTSQNRLTGAIALTGALLCGLILAQGPGTYAQDEGVVQVPGRAGGAGRGGAGQGGGGQAGQGQPAPARRGGFTQFTRPLASQDVLVRGRALYETNCASCHNVDLRGGDKGANLLRSGIALRDQKGELVTFAINQHKPPFNFTEADSVAVAEYIHSIHATMAGQGSPPGRYPQNITLNVLVGDPKIGEQQFGRLCGSCHSATGDMRGIGGKFKDARALQNGWVSASMGAAAGGGGGGQGGGPQGAGLPAVVTMADGSKLEGTLVRQTDFLVVLTLADGTRKSMARVDGVPKVDVRDSEAGHKATILKLAFEDSDNSIMHNITAYLATLK